ncbi:uncharacterized protein BDW47DRAFT_105035 [Aspergillus candidus]|uniref:Uncharacterized protein n=1 Tax=Aspergillus candidus TaxID=41067 RepID=A0A2I2FD39_ASPCN|nr:hypothetical protein BDW47DRAFT_105035 [Aspergillus candidus]PLB38548.1 hypothetical protein BDW47DRAFT_105035 [Aspergillus candidus]
MDTPADWGDTARSQLKDDVSPSLHASDRLFGALAIGKKVRFYQFNGESLEDQKLVALHQGTIDMDESTGITHVENMLDYIKANRWNWAT